MNKQDLNGITLGHGIQWPDNKPIAVCLGIDFEAETLRISQLARQGREPDERDQGRYGANEGIRRILKCLDDFSVKATFFTPAWVVENYPSQIRQIVSAGRCAAVRARCGNAKSRKGMPAGGFRQREKPQAAKQEKGLTLFCVRPSTSALSAGSFGG